MKLKAGQVEGFLRSPDPSVRAVLIYGPDTGLVRERLDRLTRHVVEDPGDPFRVADIPAAALRDDPARLADEAAAMALTGGRRVVRVKECSDGVSGLFEDVLADSKGDALVLLSAGELGPRSPLRLLFERHERACALPCYADEGAGLETLIVQTLKAHGLAVEPDALTWLESRLGADRLLTRSELDKLACYALGQRTVTLEDAIACIGDSAALGLDDLALAVADGDEGAALRILDRLRQEGESPVTVLRAAARHMQRLHLAASHVAQGKGVKQAMQSLRPPVFFKAEERFKRQLSLWPSKRLGQALDLLLQAETECKSTGAPAAVLCERALIQLARAAARVRRSGRPPSPGPRG